MIGGGRRTGREAHPGGMRVEPGSWGSCPYSKKNGLSPVEAYNHGPCLDVRIFIVDIHTM